MTPTYFQIMGIKSRVRRKNMLTRGKRGHSTKQVVCTMMCGYFCTPQKTFENRSKLLIGSTTVFWVYLNRNESQ